MASNPKTAGRLRSALPTWLATGAFLLASAVLTLTARGQRPAPAAPTARFAGGGSAAEVPMELAANAVFVPVQVGGGRPSNWLLDTASPATAAESSLFAPDAGNGNEAGGSATLTLPGIQLLEPNLLVHSFQTLGPWYGLRVGGVIGNDLLARLVAELDYSRLSIELYRPNSYRRPGHMKKIPIEWVKGLPTIRAKIRSGGRTIEGDFALNTGGSPGLVVFRSFLSAQRMLPPESKTMPGEVVDASGQQAATLMRGEWIEVGSVRVSRPIVSIVERNKAFSGAAFEKFKGASVAGPIDGWIGGRILRKFRLVLDFPQNCIFAAPNRDFVFPIEADASGATITATGENLNQFEVRDVRAGSPAAQAGLEPGDRILVIDGEEASDLSLDQIRDLLCQGGHSPVLGVERMGRKVRIELQLKQTL
ncbi:MAG TPA: PDZ domain-containing protein [Candidatus Dormibacteraeota bacterium]|nr:PDZ domain-containing protein [Candidatus Dormibacteraeota bacterium]